MANEPLTPGATLCGQSGRTYTIQEMLAERREPLLCVYRARYDPNLIFNNSNIALIMRSADGHDFIVKNMIPGEYKYQQDLQSSLASCPNLRTVVDDLPGPELFIYPYLETDVLQFSQKNLTEATRRSMLKSALVGLLPFMRGTWFSAPAKRSWPRATRGSTLFDDRSLFFGEEESLKGLLQWIGEKNPFFERLITIAGSFDSANPRKPFDKWYFVNAQFRDLVCRMTKLDPATRITSREALDHPWFAQRD